MYEGVLSFSDHPPLESETNFDFPFFDDMRDEKEFTGRVAEVGWLLASAKYSLRASVERVFANFRDKNVVFYHCVNIGSFWL